MSRLAVVAARSAGRLSRLLGRGAGATLPGRLLLRLDPEALSDLAARLGDGSTLVSATNGKTTTTSMIGDILAGTGRVPVTNSTGSNLAWGVASSLLDGTGSEGLFEVDEAWLPEVARQVEPTNILLGNLFRDQLDRHAGVEHLAGAWRNLVADRAGRTRFIVNADDPVLADLAEAGGAEVSWYGVESSPAAAGPGAPAAAPFQPCPRCQASLVYERVHFGHLGIYRCDSCEFRRPQPDVTADEVTLDGMRGLSARITAGSEDVALNLPLPGLYNLYNALGALATARSLGVPSGTAAATLARTAAAHGRVERINADGVEVTVLLVKNPVGAGEVLRTLAIEPEPVHIWLGLNDAIADGRDVGWIWDTPFELLRDRIERAWCTGTRGAEMALRLKYAGWPADRVTVDPDPDRAVRAAVAAAPDRLFALPTYSALAGLRQVLNGLSAPSGREGS